MHLAHPIKEIMRIVNQNRNHSVDFNNAEIHVDYEDVILSTNKNFLNVIGRYESNERALEVFEEIHKIYVENTDKNIVYYIPIT